MFTKKKVVSVILTVAMAVSLMACGGEATEEQNTPVAEQNTPDPDKEMQVGDELTTIWYMATYSGENDFESYAVQTVTVTADTAFAEMSLPDGSYMMMFEMRDAMGNYAYSDAVTFDCIDNEIYTTVYED